MMKSDRTPTPTPIIVFIVLLFAAAIILCLSAGVMDFPGRMR
jgi:hypothetical protein